MAISIRDIHKAYGRYPALNGVSLEIRPGELLALLGELQARDGAQQRRLARP